MDKKILIIVGVVLLVLITAALVAFKLILGGVGPVELTYWGLWEPEGVYSEVFADYKRIHPNVTIKYQKMSPLNYRERMMAEIARDGGPDIVRIHNTWLPMVRNSLQPVSSFTADSFKSTFYPVASSDLVSGGSVWGVPLEIDTLLMYANEDLLTAGGVSVPTTWEEFSPVASKLTVKDDAGKIKTAGTALGSAGNVDHWQDILSLMSLQSTEQTKADINAGNSQAAIEAFQFYTSFENVSHSWDETLDGSTLAFANGQVGFYFGPSWRYFDIKDINPNLNFTVHPVPQLSGGTPVNFATYWAEAISKKSTHAKEAAEFLKFLSSKEELAKIYSAEAKLRGFGEPYSRTDMGSLLSSDPTAGIVVSQAPSAKGWYLASFTNDGDTGINSKVGKYYMDAVNLVNQGQNADASKALETVAAGLSQVLGQYGISSSTR